MNVGSLKTSSHWRHTDDQVICLQETRIGRNNHRSAIKEVQSCGKSLFCGELLPGIIRTDGHHTTTHGGTAVIAAETLVSPFLYEQDQTGKYKAVFASKRANACWVQITRSMRALVFSVYAKSGASANHEILLDNDQLFSDVFEIVSQFGDIPILIAGDFQTLPSNYPAVSNAVHFHRWADPLQEVNDEGDLFRPLTFSLDASFAGSGDGCSSIDAILVNHVAHAALTDIQVIGGTGSQHRPIRAWFSWNRISLTGDIHLKTAALDTDHLPKGASHGSDWVNDIAKSLCPDVESFLGDDLSTEQIWSKINKLCLDTLVKAGATWGFGKRARGFLPDFASKTICPGQLPCGSATTCRGSKLHNTLSRLCELFTRVSRAVGSPADVLISQKTSLKCRRALKALHAPCVWTHKGIPSLVEIDANLSWIRSEAQALVVQRKKQRIALWKEKIQTDEKGTMRFIYHHLRNRARDEPSNLVHDESGHIIFHPRHAIAAINDKWDDIFSANVSHEEPLNVLRVVWPYLDHDAEPWSLPPLAGADILQTIQNRNPLAAAGLDGWRTSDLQKLPVTCCDAVAAFFNRLEADCESSIPDVLVRAKQIILNKPGLSTPMNKRLIAIMSPLLLAYSGTRFRQLQEWQRTRLPVQLCGGVQGRTMASVSVGLRLDIDTARCEQSDLVGIKLDQSKCFDRIVPAIAGVLFLAFGMPKGVVNVFLKTYVGLKKHLSYRGWVSRAHSTCANGVAQGCSLSLLAINTFMAVWVKFVSLIPHVTCKVFIDDAYLWVRIQHLHHLQTALLVTKQWNNLIGQKLNPDKSTLWATSTAARNQAKVCFPDIPLALEFDALGAKIYTSQRNATACSPDRVAKIRADIKNIAALPVSRKSKSKLIAARIIPQCSFAAEITDLTKKAVSDLQTDIVTALWENRPHWRSKMLVLSLLAEPCLVDPKVARAFTAIRNFWRFVHANPDVCETLCDIFPVCIDQPHSLLHTVSEALRVFHITLFADLTFGIADVRIPLLEVTFKDLKQLLYALGKQACYELSVYKPRKDLCRPTGIIDTTLSRLFLQKYKPPKASKENLSPFFESQLVGCTITNDRRHAAGFAESNLCRFCNGIKEALKHIVQDCPKCPEQLRKCVVHDLGPNYANFGIVEHPPAIVAHRLRWLSWTDSAIVPFQPHLPKLERWTDGSVVFGQYFWLATAAFAIVNENEECLDAGRVHHPGISAFAAELYAVLIAAAQAPAQVCIYTDCLTVVDLFADMVANNRVCVTWSHQIWWKNLFHIWSIRSAVQYEPLILRWIPAHKSDNVPLEHVDQTLADNLQIPLRHLRCNRVADLKAKEVAFANAPVHPKVFQQLQYDVFQRQSQLAILNRTIGTEMSVRKFFQTKEDICSTAEVFDVRKRFPNWLWKAEISSFLWTPTLTSEIHDALTHVFGTIDASSIGEFWSSLHWQCGEQFSVSYIELAFLFCRQKRSLEKFAEPNVTVAQIQKVLKRAAGIIFSLSGQQLIPGLHDAVWAHKCGRALPKGSIRSARPFFADPELECFAHLLLDGKNQSLTTWDIAPADCFGVT